MKAYRLTPYTRSDLWGGTRLHAYGKSVPDADTVSESWELSFVTGRESRLSDGRQVSEVFGKDAFGARCARFGAFPVLTKFIDAAKNLSVQVHPCDEYALRHEGQYGKCEMWYIIDAAPGAGLYLGMNAVYDKERVRADALSGAIEHDLHFQCVHPAEVYLLPPGTIHAIGAGVLLFEIQQNSALTYRLYDYNRPDRDGKPRPLHLDRAMDVAKLEPYIARHPKFDDSTIIGKTPYFETHLYKLNLSKTLILSVTDAFFSLSVIEGEGIIDGQECKKGDTFFIPANSGDVCCTGKMTLIGVTV